LRRIDIVACSGGIKTSRRAFAVIGMGKRLRRQCGALSVEMKRNNGAVAIVITILCVFQDHLSSFQYWLYLLYINKLR